MHFYYIVVVAKSGYTLCAQPAYKALFGASSMLPNRARVLILIREKRVAGAVI